MYASGKDDKIRVYFSWMGFELTTIVVIGTDLKYIYIM
jgi:hypothetical protein